MDNAYEIIKEAREKALYMMGSGLSNLNAKELDYIAKLCEIHNDTCKFVEIAKKHDIVTGQCAANAADNETDWTIRRIDSELAAAETYCAEWLKTGSAVYKQLAADELRHADIFIKEAKAAGISPEALQSAMTRHSAIAADLA